MFISNHHKFNGQMMNPRDNKEELIEIGKRTFSLIESWIESDDGWKNVESGKGFDIYSRQIKKEDGFHDSGTVFKGSGFVPHATLEEFMDIVLNHDKRELWDKNSNYYYPIESIDEYTDICHVGVKGWFGVVSERDFITIRRSFLDKEKKKYMACQTSINIDIETKIKKKCVRGKLLPSTWTFIEKEGGCHAYFISGVNLGGWIPMKIVEKAVCTNTKNFYPDTTEYFKQWIKNSSKK